MSGTSTVKTSPVTGTVLIAVVLAVCFLVMRDYGITVDEPLHHASGEINIRHFFGSVQPIADYHNLKFYGPLSDMIGALSFDLIWTRMQWVNPVDARHVHLIVFFALSVHLMFRITSRLWGTGTALLSCTMFVLNPRVFGHVFNNPKEIPLIFWFMFTTCCLFRRAGTGSMVWTVAAGAAWGAGLATKINALLLLPAIAVWVFYIIRTRVIARIDGKKAVVEAAAFMGSGVIVVLCFWPWLRASWFQHSLELFRFFSKHPKTGIVLYWGRIYEIGAAPWHYGLTHLLLTTPLVVLICAAVGFVWKGRQHHAIVFFLGWFFLGILPQSVPGSVIYDGPRHFLPVVPPLTMAAGFAGVRIINTVKRSRDSAFWRHAVFLAVAVWISVRVSIIWQYHPYQICYYNVLTGGVKGAEGRFEIWSWGHSLRNAVRKVNGFAPPNSRVLVPYPAGLARYYLRPDLEESGRDPSVVITSDFRESREFQDREPVATISVKGVILNRIYHNPGSDPAH
ncbi:glycosyltransferase family 39 protein [bacterium]|nr:glycosyltransferase family 39 protein [candidate division CSSED10-310 bacterium]